jgi:hypothetical protein
MSNRPVRLGRTLAEHSLRVATDAFVRWYQRHEDLTCPVEEIQRVVGETLERRLPEAIADAQAAFDQGQGTGVALEKYDAVCVLAGIEAATTVARAKVAHPKSLDTLIPIRLSVLGSAVGRIDN